MRATVTLATLSPTPTCKARATPGVVLAAVRRPIASGGCRWRLRAGVEAGGTGIYQILASKRNRGEWPVPLSRRNLYAGRDGRFGGVN